MRRTIKNYLTKTEIMSRYGISRSKIDYMLRSGIIDSEDIKKMNPTKINSKIYINISAIPSYMRNRI